MSKYIDIVGQIKKDILSERYKFCLPKHEELAEIYHTSRVTISHVIRLLSSQGFVTPLRGRGTFINKGNLVQRQIDEPFHLTNVFPGRATSEVISFEVREADEVEMKKFKLQQLFEVYDIIRLRLVDNLPLQLEYTQMPVVLLKGLNDRVLHQSIYAFMVDELHLCLGKSNKIIRADKPDAYDEKYLQVDRDTPILEIEQVGFLKNGQAFEFSHTRTPYNQLELTFDGQLKAK
jgi:GntR family transcriptional regulator